MSMHRSRGSLPAGAHRCLLALTEKYPGSDGDVELVQQEAERPLAIISVNNDNVRCEASRPEVMAGT